MAIKTLNDTLRQRPDFDKWQQDFLKEGMNIKGCQHRHIVKVFDVIQEGGLWCLVMEYIHGEDLETRIRSGVLPEDEALGYIRQVGEALKVIHAQGLLHRDVKPANIMVRFTNNEAVLIDFGIAREFTTDLTQTHTIYRTECYAPIEQYDPRAKRGAYMDVYALAATLYVLLTGKLPTPAPNRMARDTLIAPKQFNHGISDKVNRGILKGMELRRERRPQSVQAWLRLLGLESSQREEGGDRTRFKQMTSWAGGLVATVILGLVLDHLIAPFLIDVPVVGAVVLQLCKAANASCGDVESSPESNPTKSPTVPKSEPESISTKSPIVRASKPKSSPPIATDSLTSEVGPKATIPERFVLDKTLTEHSSSVRSVAISPDGKTVASGSSDQTIKLWNLETGQLQRTIKTNSRHLHSVATSFDEKTVATGSLSIIELWNLETGKLKRTIRGHYSNVWSVAFSPDGKILVSGSLDKTIKLWNMATEQLQRTLRGHSDYITSVAISPDGKTLASGSYDKTIKLWNLETGQLQRTLTGHYHNVWSVVFSPDGQTLASGSDDFTIKLWDLETGQLQRTLVGHLDRVESIAFSPDGNTLSSGGRDDTIKLWNLKTGDLQVTLTNHSGTIRSLAFSPDGQTLVSGSDDKTINIWQQQ